MRAKDRIRLDRKTKLPVLPEASEAAEGSAAPVKTKEKKSAFVPLESAGCEQHEGAGEKEEKEDEVT